MFASESFSTRSTTAKTQLPRLLSFSQNIPTWYHCHWNFAFDAIGSSAVYEAMLIGTELARTLPNKDYGQAYN